MTNQSLRAWERGARMMNKNLKTWILEENMRRWENKMGATRLCESGSR